MKKINMINKTFGRLTVIKCCGIDNNGGYTSLCLCECGNQVVKSNSNLIRGLTKSCGCLNSELACKRLLIHGLSKNSTYVTWKAMIDRCNNPNNKGYVNYGDRGITVCGRWSKFEVFLRDMGERPKNLQLDRIDNDGDYQPGNCRWTDCTTNLNNRRNNRIITANGQSKTASEWSKLLNVPYANILNRLNLKWRHEDIISLPFKKGIRYNHGF